MGRALLIAVRILAAGAPLQAAEAPLLAASEKAILAGDERGGVLPPATGADTTPASVSPVSAGERGPLTPLVATRVSFPGIAPGARVRILPPAQFVFARHVPESSNRTWNPLHQPVTGFVTAMDDQSLTVRLDGSGELRFDLESVARLEHSLGKRRRTAEGALFGGCLLGVPMALLGVLATGVGAIGCDPLDCPDEGDSTRAAIAFAAVGVAFGALIGTTIQTEKWRLVESRRIRAQVGPGPRGGLSASLSLRF